MHLGIRRFLALLGIVAVLGAVAVATLWPNWQAHLKDYSEREILQALKAVMGEHVEIDKNLDFVPRRKRAQDIRFKRLVVRPAIGAEPILRAEEVIIELDPWPVVKMSTPEVLRVTFYKPRITIRRDEDGTLNFVTLVEAVRDYRASLSEKLKGAKTPPTVNIKDGTIEIVDSRYLAEPIVLEHMDLEIGGVGAASQLGKLSINGFSKGGKWKFGGEIALTGERVGLDNVVVTGTFISLDDQWEGRLHGALGEMWRALEPSGVLRQIKVVARYDAQGELLITTELDASQLEFGLLEETIGEKLQNFTAEVSVGVGGTVVKARAEGDPARRNVLFGLEGRFGAASKHPDHDVLKLQISDLVVDRKLRRSLTKLMHISRGLRGQTGGDAERDLDSIWGEKIARSIFDRHEPRGILGIEMELLLPRGIEGDPQFVGEVSIRDGSLQVPIGAKRDGTELDVTLENLEGVFSFVGDTIQVKPGTRVMGTVDDSPISFAGSVTNALERKSSTWIADFRAEDLRLNETLLDDLSGTAEDGRSSSWLQVLQDYQVQGVADISVRLMGGAGGVPFRLISIQPSGEMSFVHPAFPYPIQEIAGHLDISGHQVDFKLTGFQKRPEDGSDPSRRAIVEMKGDINRLGTENERSTVTIHAHRMRVDDEVLSALAAVRPELGRILDEELHARGTIDVAVKYEKTPDPNLGRSVARTNMNVDVIDCYADWAGTATDLDAGALGFRYRLLGLTGQVRIRDQEVTLEDIRGESVDGEEFIFSGEMHAPGTDESMVRLNILAPSLAFSDNLRSLLSTVDNDYVNLWDDFSPEGNIAFEYEMKTAAGEPDSTYVHIVPDGCTARAVHFPMAVRNISSGSVTIRDGRVSLDHLTSYDEATGAQIVIHGHVGASAEDVRLKVSASKLPLNDQLRHALPQSVQEVWDLFELSGTTGVTATLTRSPGDAEGDLDIDVTATLQGVDVRYKARPAQLSEVTGRLIYSNHARDGYGVRRQQIEFHELSAQVLGGTVEVTHGTLLGTGADRRASIKLVGKKLDLEHPDLRLVDPQVHALLVGLRASGSLGADAILVLEGEDLEGLSSQGTVTASNLQVRDLHIDDLSANILLKDRILDLSELRGSIYGGSLDAQLSADMSAFAAFRGSLQIHGVNVKPFVADVFGVESEKLSGLLSANLDFSGLGTARESIVGRGDVAVRDGWLWEMPFFLGILDSVPIDAKRLQDDERGFRACEASFRIGDGMVRFDQIHVDANTLRVQGRGDMDFDGALNMVVAASSTPPNKIPVLSDLISGVATSLIGFAVKGTYREPILEVQPIRMVTDILAGITDAWGADIVGKE